MSPPRVHARSARQDVQVHSCMLTLNAGSRQASRRFVLTTT